MTDPTPDPLDELASARLDGDSVTSAPEGVDEGALAERTRAFEEVRQTIRGGIEAPPESVREANLAAALAELDSSRAREASGTATGEVVAHRRGGWPRWAAAVAAAAAVVLLAFALPSMLDDGRSDDDLAAVGTQDAAEDDSATALGADADATAGDGAESASREAGGEAETAQAPPAIRDLGSHADLASLRTAVTDLLDAPAELDEAPPTTTLPGGADSTRAGDAGEACLAQLSDSAAEAGQTVVLTGHADLDGVPVVLVAVAEPSGDRSVVIADPAADCTTVATEPLDP